VRCSSTSRASRAKVAPFVVGLLRDRLQAARQDAHRTLARALADFDATSLREDLGILVARGGVGPEKRPAHVWDARRGQSQAVRQELRALGLHFAPMAFARHSKALSLAALRE